VEVGDENDLKDLVPWLFVEVTLVVVHRRETSVYYKRDPDMLRVLLSHPKTNVRSNKQRNGWGGVEFIRGFRLETGTRMSRLGG
jgi:hypothetical protein